MVGSIVMTLISIIGLIGLGFDIREIHNSIGKWGLTWFELIFVLLIISFWIVVIKLILKINQYERNRPKLDVKWKSQVGREISLIVKNNGRIATPFEAVISSFNIIYMRI